MVAVSLTTLLGFVALSVDVGMLYSTKAELQRTADAAAMAAAAALANTDGGDLSAARAAAINFAALNEVQGSAVLLDVSSDIIFGRAHIDSTTNKYVFQETQNWPNAVRVRARRTVDSPSGAVPLLFARLMGHETADVSAQATAVLTPRDIVFVLDLSASHNDDSSLVHYRLTDISNKQVWAHLWDSGIDLQPMLGGVAQGPIFGNMREWGADVTGPSWDYANDPGLIRLRRGSNWGLSSDWVSQSLSSKGYGSYTSSEMNVINSSSGAGTETSYSSSTQKANYRRRARVALGLDRWKSGKSGGQPGGNGDNVIDSWEVVPLVPYPSSSSNPSTSSKEIGGSWDQFVDYVSDISKSDTITSNTGLSQRFLKYQPSSSYYGNPNLRWRFGLKLLVDFVQDKYPQNDDSPGLSGAPEEPMGSVANAVLESLGIIEELQSNDMIGTAAYGSYGYGPQQKPSHLSWLTTDVDEIRQRVSLLQAGMWTNNTNIAQGIDKGVDVLLNSPNARPNAAKTIILLTDGLANMTRSGGSGEYQAYQDTLAAAQDAHNACPQKIRIYAVSVGADSDQALMSQVAQIGQGEHFHAEGDVATYRQQLEDIFRNLGGKRPVTLAQ
jgi:hypothetical protein